MPRLEPDPPLHRWNMSTPEPRRAGELLEGGDPQALSRLGQ